MACCFLVTGFLPLSIVLIQLFKIKTSFIFLWPRFLGILKGIEVSTWVACPKGEALKQSIESLRAGFSFDCFKNLLTSIG